MPGEGQIIDHMANGDLIAKDGNVKGKSVIATKASNHVLELFDTTPAAALKGGGAAAGTTGAINMLAFNSSNWELQVLGAGQTLINPVMIATGLDISGDDADNEGVEIYLGLLNRCKGIFKIGTDDAFFARMRFAIATVGSADIIQFGFRGGATVPQAAQADYNDYTDMACMDIANGRVDTVTAINNAAVVRTDTTEADWADSEVHEIEVRVSADGVVTYRYDGGEPTTVVAFTFDDGDVVTPYFHVLHDASADLGCALQEFECGLQSERA